MIRKSFSINRQPAKTYASMKVDAASTPVQEYDALSGQHYPDRSLVPLVLTPVLGYIEPDTGTEVSNAASLLTDGHWYRIDANSGGVCDTTTEITSGTTYIIDTTAGSATYGRIQIKENVDPDNPVTYIFRAVMVLPNGEKVLKMISWQARTKATETLPRLQLDNAGETMYNPWSDTPSFTLNPVLKPAVAGSTIRWETYHGSQWGALGSTHYDWAISTNGDGITIDRSRMQDQLLLRCVCEYPVNGTQQEVTVTASVTRRLPKFEYDINRLGDILPTDTQIAPGAVIRTNDDIISDPKGEVSVKWYNAAGTQIAEGMSPLIPLSALGSSNDIGLEVKDMGGWKALETADGKYITTSDGKLIICR